MDGAADVAETTYTPFRTEPGAAPARLIVRRVKPTPGSQLGIFATYTISVIKVDDQLTNEISDPDLTAGSMPSGRFAAKSCNGRVGAYREW